jgi:tetratricopeptide (TPR) repeat protein
MILAAVLLSCLLLVLSGAALYQQRVAVEQRNLANISRQKAEKEFSIAQERLRQGLGIARLIERKAIQDLAEIDGTDRVRENLTEAAKALVDGLQGRDLLLGMRLADGTIGLPGQLIEETKALLDVPVDGQSLHSLKYFEVSNRIKKAIRRLSILHNGGGGRLKEVPLHIASLFSRLGSLNFRRGQFDLSQAALKSSEYWLRDVDASRGRRQIEAINLNLHSELALKKGKVDAALQHGEKSLRLLEEDASTSQDLAGIENLAAGLFAVAGLEMKSGYYRAALAKLANAARLFEQVIRLSPGRHRSRAGLANIHDRRGHIYMHMEDYQVARDEFRAGLQIRLRHSAAAPKDLRRLRSLCSSYFNLGQALVRLHEYEEANLLFERDFRIISDLIEQHPDDLDLQSEYATTLEAAGESLMRVGRTQKASALLLESERLRRKLIARHSGHLQMRIQLASVLATMGDLYVQTGEDDKARSAFTEAYDELSLLVDGFSGHFNAMRKRVLLAANMILKHQTLSFSNKRQIAEDALSNLEALQMRQALSSSTYRWIKEGLSQTLK